MSHNNNNNDFDDNTTIDINLYPTINPLNQSIQQQQQQNSVDQATENQNQINQSTSSNPINNIYINNLNRISSKGDSNNTSNNEPTTPGGEDQDSLALEDEESGNNKKSKMNPFLRCFIDYYSIMPSPPNEQLIINPHHDIMYLPGGKIKFNRWFLFPSAFLVQFCLGSLYAISIFNKPIDSFIYGNPTQGMAPITFYIAVAFFGASACLLGPWVEKSGSRVSMLVGSSLFTIGHFIAAFGIYQKAIWEVYVGYGCISGIGLGITYLSPISCLQKWFPDHRGLAAGFAVCGFGAGSIGFSQAVLPLIAQLGLPVTFVVIGIIFLCVIWPQAVLFRAPPTNYVINGVRSDGRKEPMKKKVVVEEDGAQIIREVEVEATIEGDIFSREAIQLSYALTSREFRLIYVIFICNAVFGLAAMSRLSNMVQDIFGRSKEVAAMVVAVNGAFNLTGRLGFAFVSDIYGRKTCFIVMLTIQAIVVGILPVVIEARSYGGFIVSIWIITLCYGGGFGIIPAFLTDMFGPQNVSACHGVILTAWSISGVAGGLIFTTLYNYYLSNGYEISDPILYTMNIHWVFVIVMIGWFCLPFIRTSPRDIYMPPMKGQIMRIRIFGRMVRLSTAKGLEFVKKFVEDEEWYQFVFGIKKKILQRQQEIEQERAAQQQQQQNTMYQSLMLVPKSVVINTTPQLEPQPDNSSSINQLQIDSQHCSPIGTTDQSDDTPIST